MYVNDFLYATTCKCGVLMHLVTSVCLSVCLSEYPVWAPAFKSLDLKTSFLQGRYIFRISRSSLYIKVIGSRSRSQGQEGHTSVVCLQLTGLLSVCLLSTQINIEYSRNIQGRSIGVILMGNAVSTLDFTCEVTGE